METEKTFYLTRWRAGEWRRGKQFPSIGEDHPSAREVCIFCGGFLSRPIADNPAVQLVILFPMESEREAYEAGQWVKAHALLVHAYCLAMKSDADLDRMAEAITFKELPQDPADAVVVE